MDVFKTKVSGPKIINDENFNLYTGRNDDLLNIALDILEDF